MELFAVAFSLLSIPGRVYCSRCYCVDSGFMVYPWRVLSEAGEQAVSANSETRTESEAKSVLGTYCTALFPAE